MATPLIVDQVTKVRFLPYPYAGKMRQTERRTTNDRYGRNMCEHIEVSNHRTGHISSSEKPDMTERYLAHIDRDSGRIQTCREHLLAVAEMTRRNLRPFGLGNTGFLAGILHDAGKYSDEFQEYIRKDDPTLRGTVVHSSAGASFVLRRFHSAEGARTRDEAMSDMTAEIIAYAIGAHHGLFDITRPDDHTCGFDAKIARQPEIDRRAEEAFLSDFAGDFDPDFLFGEAENEIRSVFPLIQGLLVNKGYKATEYRFHISMLQRLVCSALIDADRTDAAVFYGTGSVSCNPDWNGAVSRIENRVSALPAIREIDSARKAFSDVCADAAGRKPGIYRLNLPTGGGKTLSSLRFAALQAAHMEASRIVYVSPLLSIIEQNEAVFRDVLGDGMVLAHHTDLASEDKHDDFSNDNKDDYSSADILRQNWNAPVVVTTLVRVLYAMFRADTSDIRLFHALGNSIIIFDEVQSVPRCMLSLFNLACSFIARVMNSVIILCSATQPTFEYALHPMTGIGEDIVSRNIIDRYSSVFTRTMIENTGSMTLDTLREFAAERADVCRSLLVVCNTKKEAQNLFAELAGKYENVFHLSSGMCMEHRKEVLNLIRESLEAGKKTICVSTQVIEAGVDISFSEVIRLAAGLDNVVQAAGRCNRHGESPVPGNVWVVNLSGERLSMLREIQDGKSALLNVSVEGSIDLSSGEAVERYYRLFFNQSSEPDAQDYPVKDGTSCLKLMSDIRDTQTGRWFLGSALKTAGTLFRVFDENMVSVLVEWKKGTGLAEELASIRARKDLAYRSRILKEAAGYSVSVYDGQFERLEAEGAITGIEYEDGTSVFVLSQENYDPDTGLMEKGKCTTIMV